MKSVDTNVLARLVVQDDPIQHRLARRVVEAGVFVPITVLLELGWLLQSRYQMERAVASGALRQLLRNPFIHFADQASIETALDLYQGGSDLADAIHLVAARGSEAFVTFDRGVPNVGSLDVPVEYLG